MKSKIILLTILFLNLIVSSQTLQLSKSGDTLICFSTAQAKFLAKQNYKAETYFKSDSICQAQIYQKNLEIKMYKKIDNDRQTVINNQASIIRLKDSELKEAKIVIENANIEAKKQKKYKVLSLLGGALISGYLGFKYITK